MSYLDCPTHPRPPHSPSSRLSSSFPLGTLRTDPRSRWIRVRSLSRHRSDIREARQPVPTSDVLQGGCRCGAGNRSRVLCAGHADVRVHQERAQGSRGEGRERICVSRLFELVTATFSSPVLPDRFSADASRLRLAQTDTSASTGSNRASSNSSAAPAEKQERSLGKDTPSPARPSRQKRLPPRSTTCDGSSLAH